jgi:hypothetical protein
MYVHFVDENLIIASSDSSFFYEYLKGSSTSRFEVVATIAWILYFRLAPSHMELLAAALRTAA